MSEIWICSRRGQKIIEIQKIGATFLILIAGVIIFYFLRVRDRDRMLVSNVDANGGMKIKYSELIGWLRSDPNAKITKITRDHITISNQMLTTRTDFYLTENFDGLDVDWNANLGRMGRHQLKWKFKKGMNQEDMIIRIGIDIQKYEQKIFG